MKCRAELRLYFIGGFKRDSCYMELVEVQGLAHMLTWRGFIVLLHLCVCCALTQCGLDQYYTIIIVQHARQIFEVVPDPMIRLKDRAISLSMYRRNRESKPVKQVSSSLDDGGISCFSLFLAQSLLAIAVMIPVQNAVSSELLIVQEPRVTLNGSSQTESKFSRGRRTIKQLTHVYKFQHGS